MSVLERASRQSNRTRAVNMVRRALELEENRDLLLSHFPEPEKWKKLKEWERLNLISYWLFAECKRAIAACPDITMGRDPRDTVGTRD